MKIVVVSDSPFFQKQVHGGLQAVFQHILSELSPDHSLAFFCGAETDITLPGTATLYPSFTAEPRFDPAYHDSLIKELKDANLVVSLETKLPVPTDRESILIMGGVAYDWSEK